MTTKLFTAVMGTALLALAGCQSTQDKTPADTLVATFTSAAPNLAADTWHTTSTGFAPAMSS